MVVRAEDGIPAEQLLRELSLAGFRLTALSNLDARLAEGYLPLGSALWSGNPNRFHVGPASGVSRTDMTFTVTNASKTFTINFAPGSFAAGDSFRFGMSVFNALQGSTQEDPDRFRGMTMTVTLDDDRTFTGTVFAGPKVPIDRFTGFGLVNAEAAVRSVRHGH